VDGLELSFTGNLTDCWSVLTSYAHLDSEFVASANPLEQGAALAFVPENSFNVWTKARLVRGFSVGAGAQYMDSIFRNATSTAEVPSYWLINAMAAYDVSRTFTLRLNVNNLANECAERSVSINAEFGF
jgi:catecholate siderophore receptor